MLDALRSLCILALMLGSSACTGDRFARTSVAERHKATLAIVEKCDSGADSFEHDGVRYCPHEGALHVRVEDVTFSQDDNGYPGVGVEFAAADEPLIHDWTAKNAGNTVALLVGREAFFLGKLLDPFGRNMMISGGAGGFTIDEVKAMRSRIRAALVAGR